MVARFSPWILAACLPLFGGCALPNMTGQSPLRDTADVAVTGELLTPDGAPYGAIAVRLEKEAPAQRDWDDGTAIAEATTDDAGQYAFRMKGHTTKNAFGEAHYYRLIAQRETGQRVSYRFQIRKSAIALPALHFWNGLAAPTIAPGMLHLAWTPPPEPAKAYHLEVATPDGKPIWQRTSSTPLAALPQYMFANGASYRAQVEAVLDPFYVASDYRLLTSALDAEKRLLPIVGVTDDKGGAYPGLFDGELAAPGGDGRRSDAEALTVDLGSPREVSRLVLYGAREDLEVQASEDGEAWRTVRAAVGEPCADLDMAGARARHLRLLRRGGDNRFSHMREIRVVGPSSAAP